MKLQDLEFSDLYVAEDARECWYKPTPDSLNVVPVAEACAEELMALRKFLAAQAVSRGTSFRVQWPPTGGPRMRVGQMQISTGKSLFVCRRYRMAPGDLKSLGVPPHFAKKLYDTTLTEGLVVFMGKTGSGKTTTAASFILERLRQHGGVCWTVENPIEIPMHGQHGKGWCYQTEVSSDENIGQAIRDMLRASPNIIFIGELRGSQAVREAITASISGHLVVATFHAGDLVSGLSRLAMLANNDKISAALADALRVAAHLTLHIAEPGKTPPPAALPFTLPESKGTGAPPRILSFEPLWMDSGLQECLQSIVRDGSFHMLHSEVERQRRSAMMNRNLP
ncbi:ATPase, T2SS/T4P/T4SS family [Cupriavidus necator]|uniref:ATPase, T2SS/T4P/T4SS family n=1 Tax=Cupriavidus necator TaxID=106590 RepID=UPI003ECF641C